MKPPFFVWKSGLLDAFDTIEELEERYAANDLAGDDCTLYDSAGTLLTVSAQANGAARISCDEHQPSQRDALAAMLRSYLERGGMSSERSHSLTLHELIQAVYPFQERAGLRARREERAKPEWSPVQYAHPDPASVRLVDTFGLALAVGALAAGIAAVGMLVYDARGSSQSLGNQIGVLGILAGDCLWAGIVGALIGGLGFFWRRLARFNLHDVLPSKSVSRAVWALIPILVAVGAVVSLIVFFGLLACGTP